MTIYVLNSEAGEKNVYLNIKVWTLKGSKCLYIRKQIEPSNIHP